MAGRYLAPGSDFLQLSLLLPFLLPVFAVAAHSNSIRT